ncbi:hypothetical protein ABZ829_12265 [Streptomyces xanthochromogenes]|uniref:hypothetical protein n=1 Tax=Streptomyces xanthochromogenes TaxID=67384 RepID=UPI00342C2407
MEDGVERLKEGSVQGGTPDPDAVGARRRIGPRIVQKLTIKTGKNKDPHASLGFGYQALAEAGP